MNTNLSMQCSMNQVHHSLREKEEDRLSVRRRALPILIMDYLVKNGYTGATLTEMLNSDWYKSCNVCDNIDLETILAEYDNYYRMKFNKYPMLYKPVVTKAKTQLVSKVKGNDSVKQKDVQQTINDNPVEDISSAMTVTPIFAKENEYEMLSKEMPDLSKKQSMQSKMSHIEKLYAGDSELRKIAEDISREIVLNNLNVHWNDVVGLNDCKNSIKEAIVYPLKYPIFFADKFSPWKGILLYGAPGTGKTMLAKAVATECNCTFFNITASSLISKWRGDSEKYIRVLFDLAYSYSPTIIFIDEIDWIATNIQDNSLSEPAKRFRSELLIRLDGIVTNENSNVVLLAATNAPWNIDAALLRRIEKRIYVPLPCQNTRSNLFKLYVSNVILEVDEYRHHLLKHTEGYTCADIKLLCKQAWILQQTPTWEKLERNEISITKLKYELTDFETLDHLLTIILPTCTSVTKYTEWTNSHKKETAKQKNMYSNYQ